MAFPAVAGAASMAVVEVASLTDSTVSVCVVRSVPVTVWSLMIM